MKFVRSVSLVLVFCLSFSFLSFAASIDVNAKAAILIDGESGQVLYSKNPDEKLYPASITKLMTALIIIEENNLEDIVTVTDTALQNLSAAGSTAGLKQGDSLSVDSLLVCLLVKSANEAANVLAEYNAGSVDAFIEKMNKRAESLGLKNTHFVNAHGLHDDDHYTSARDVAIISQEIVKHPRIAEIVSMAKATIPETNIVYHNTNSLVSKWNETAYFYQYATGIKTGHTTPAGRCLSASAEKDGRILFSVILGAQKTEAGIKEDFTETTKMFEWGFSNFQNKTLLEKNAPIAEVKVTLASDRDHVIAATASDFSGLVPIDYDETKLKLVKNDIPGSLEAPVKKGSKLGTVTIVYDGTELGTVDLLAVDSVERSTPLYLMDSVYGFFSFPLVKIILIVLGAFIVFYIFYVVRFNKKKRNSNRYRGGRRRR